MVPGKTLVSALSLVATYWGLVELDQINIEARAAVSNRQLRLAMPEKPVSHEPQKTHDAAQ
jgi:hypothetical protein